MFLYFYCESFTSNTKSFTMVNTRSMSQQNSDTNTNENSAEFHDAQSIPIANTASLPMSNIHNVSHLTVKLPKFWVSCPESWFIQTELTFTYKGILDDTTKYQLVVIALSEDILNRLIDVIHNPPTENKYDYIKRIMLERFSVDEDLRFEKLLNDSDIGDRKPSEFFHDLSKLALNNSLINNDLLIKLWMRKLPPTIQINLTSSKLTSLNEKLTLADKIYEISNKPQVSSVTSITPTSNDIFQNFIQITTNLAEKVDNLSREVSEIRNVSGNINSINKSHKNRIFCWYHKKFGNKAMKCISPCDYVVRGNTQNLN